ncbi:MAG: DUF305 domain-containing protein [Gemmatimonadales bacterium]
MIASRWPTTAVFAVCTLGIPALIPAALAQSAPAYTEADVQFMQGMIYHHAQALQMCALPLSHGASEKVALLCKKITISQRDEIAFMQHWLEDRRQAIPHPVTDTLALHGTGSMAMMPGMPGMSTPHLMPGMLTPEQMTALDQARDTVFDRLFLAGMIQHHTGAIRMVAELFNTPGSGQGADIFGYATGVDADQRAEIGRMEQLLKIPTGSNQS